MAFLGEDGSLVALHPMPLVPGHRKGDRDSYDLAAIRGLLLERQAGLVVTVERSQPLPPKMGGAIANFERGVTRGWEWLLLGLGIPCQLVPPQTWQRVMHVGTAGRDTKARSIEAARRLWPGAQLTTGKQVRPRDGMAEALLIAEWGRRAWQGQQ